MKTGSALGNSKIWRNLLWPGIGLTLAGLSAGVVSGQWGAVPMVLMILGLALVLFWVLLMVTAKEFWRSRSTQAGTNAIIAVTAMVLILALLNFLVARYPQRVDLTENQIFSLAPQSKEVVRALEKPVKAYLFSPTKVAPVENVLQSYQRLSENFSYEFVNPLQQPGLVKELGMKDQGDLILQTEGNNQFVQNIAAEQFSESDLTNALARINSGATEKVYFLEGHGELDMTQLGLAQELLSDRGYESESFNLAAAINSGGALPDDASAIVVAGPQRSLLEPEVTALKDYLAKGGGLLLLIDPNTEPKLDALLSDWGVTLDDRLIIDGSGGLGVDATGGVVGFGPTAPLVNRYGNHPITEDFGNGNSFFPSSRAVNLAEATGVDATPLLITNEQSWAEKDVESQVQFDPSRDLKGPLSLGAALSKPSTSAEGQSRLVVIGNSSFATSNILSQQLNRDVLLNSVVWAGQREGEILSISAKELTDRRLVLTPVRANLVALLAVLLLPLAGFGAAGFLWWQRR